MLSKQTNRFKALRTLDWHKIVMYPIPNGTFLESIGMGWDKLGAQTPLYQHEVMEKISWGQSQET